VAEPAAARLREKCPYWFDFGLSLALQCSSSQPFEGLAKLVVSAFQGRYKALLTRAHAACESAEQLAFVRLLSREERAVFDAGRASAQAFQAWRYSTEARLSAGAARHVASADALPALQSQERLEAAPIVRAIRRRRLCPSNDGTGGAGGA
jgi:hypothetical protein